MFWKELLATICCFSIIISQTKVQPDYKTMLPQSQTLTCGQGSIPCFGLGTYTLFGESGNSNDVREATKVAIDAGYRHIDCAWVYGTENGVGEALVEKIKDGTIKREDLFITTKLWGSHQNPNTVKKALECSLKNLQTSYVDMYLIHWPTALQDTEPTSDEKVPRDKDGNVLFAHHKHMDVWKAMEECVKAGLAKNIGLSNFNSKQITNVLNNSTIKPSNIQIEVTPYFSNKHLIQFCQDKGIVVTAFAPFGAPTRTWKGETEPILWDEPILKEIAKNKGKSIAQVILRHHLQKGLVVIPKSITPSRIKENIQVFDFELTKDEMEKIESLDKGMRVYKEEIVMTHPEYPFNELF